MKKFQVPSRGGGFFGLTLYMNTLIAISAIHQAICQSHSIPLVLGKL